MRFRATHSEIVEGDITPMIDMAFQLIAFFMVLLNFTETEQDERISLPASEIAKPGPAVPESIYLNLTPSGEVIYDGQLIGINDLRPYLIQEGNALLLKDKTRADATIIIRAHRGAEGGYVQRLMQVCQEARFERFRLRVREGTGARDLNASMEPDSDGT